MTHSIMPRGLALILLLVAADPSVAQPAPASLPPLPGPVRCPTLTEAPQSITADPKRHEPTIRYLLLIERYCRGPVEIALTEILTFPSYEFRDRRDELAGFRARLLKEEVADQGGKDWFVRVVLTASMLHLDCALRASPGDPREASHLNWSRQLMRLLEGVEEDPSFRHDWYLAVGALLGHALSYQSAAAQCLRIRASFVTSRAPQSIACAAISRSKGSRVQPKERAAAATRGN